MGAPGELEVVVEAVGDRRADGVAGPGEEVEDGLGQHVGRGVAQHVQPVGRVAGDDGQFGVGRDGPVEVDRHPVDRGGHGGVGQTPADGGRDLAGGHPGGVLPGRAVGKLDRDLVSHGPDRT